MPVVVTRREPCQKFQLLRLETAQSTRRASAGAASQPLLELFRDLTPLRGLHRMAETLLRWLKKGGRWSRPSRPSPFEDWRRLGPKSFEGFKIAKVNALKNHSHSLLIKITEPSQKSLNPMEQSGKKIGDEEGIGEDQCPTDHSFKVYLNFSSFSCYVNT